MISLDGLNPTALTRLGKRGTPVLHRMMRRGASTLNARTAYEMTVTLPNHTSMVTGRRIAAADGGHGVTWNDDRLTPRTVQAAAGGPVESVFTVVHDAGRQTALFASKTKFSLWQRSWPLALDQYAVELDNRRLTNAVRRDVRVNDRALTFVHLSGHRRGRPRPGLDDAGLPDRGAEGRHLRRPDPRRDRPGRGDRRDDGGGHRRPRRAGPRPRRRRRRTPTTGSPSWCSARTSRGAPTSTT